MTARMLDLEKAMPDLFASLTPTENAAVSTALAISWHHGWQPERADVAALTAYTTAAQYRQRSLRRVPNAMERHVAPERHTAHPQHQSDAAS
jgi:hypothetical protein